ELGANDALRGVDPDATRAALESILSRLEARRIAVLLAGMRAPPNMGADYTRAFDAIFSGLAATHDVVFYPFFLDGGAADRALNRAGGPPPAGGGGGGVGGRFPPKAGGAGGARKGGRGVVRVAAARAAREGGRRPAVMPVDASGGLDAPPVHSPRNP